MLTVRPLVSYPDRRPTVHGCGQRHHDEHGLKHPPAPTSSPAQWLRGILPAVRGLGDVEIIAVFMDFSRPPTTRRPRQCAGAVFDTGMRRRTSEETRRA